MAGYATTPPVEPAPCQGCRFAERCGAQRLACDAYALFMAGAAERRWCMAPRAPTAARFAALFEKNR